MDQGTGGRVQRVGRPAATRADGSRPSHEREGRPTEARARKADKHDVPPPGHPVAWATPPAATDVFKENAGRGAAERTHEIRDDIRLRIAYQNKSNHRAPPEPTKAKAASAPAAGRKRIRPDDGGQHTSIRERGRARKP